MSLTPSTDEVTALKEALTQANEGRADAAHWQRASTPCGRKGTIVVARAHAQIVASPPLVRPSRRPREASNDMVHGESRFAANNGIT